MGWGRTARALPLSGASAERGQSTGAAMAAEAGSGERGRSGPREGGPRASELRPASILGWRRWRPVRLRREDGGHGGAGERALYTLCSRELPAGGGEGVGLGVSGGSGGAEGDEPPGLGRLSRRIPPGSEPPARGGFTATLPAPDPRGAPPSLFISAHTGQCFFLPATAAGSK